jgi:hypothetical protein
VLVGAAVLANNLLVIAATWKPKTNLAARPHSTALIVKIQSGPAAVRPNPRPKSLRPWRKFNRGMFCTRKRSRREN